MPIEQNHLCVVISFCKDAILVIEAAEQTFVRVTSLYKNFV